MQPSLPRRRFLHKRRCEGRNEASEGGLSDLLGIEGVAAHVGQGGRLRESESAFGGALGLAVRALPIWTATLNYLAGLAGGNAMLPSEVARFVWLIGSNALPIGSASFALIVGHSSFV